MIEPTQASVLLELEGGHHPHDPNAALTKILPMASQPGIFLQGLDRRFAHVWCRSNVVGVSSTDGSTAMPNLKTALPIYILSEALLKTTSTGQPPPTSAASTLPDIYIVAPHTSQTIVALHSHLANTLGHTEKATELLRSVRLLQYFDLAGLVESVAEISQTLYQETQLQDNLQISESDRRDRTQILVLVQGVVATISATYRRSGLVQANALLADLTRNITRLSRSTQGVSVMVEITVEVEDTPEAGPHEDTPPTRIVKGFDLESAFTGSTGETLRLLCGHHTLSRTLEAGLDCIVVVHNGLGRIDKQKQRQERVVEVIKDRRGNLAGLWDIWKEGTSQTAGAKQWH